MEDVEHATCPGCRDAAHKEGMAKASPVTPPADTDVFPPPEPVKAKPAPSTLRVAGCELQTAPDHALVVRLTGDADELVGLRRAILRALHPEDGSEAGVLPDALSAALPKP